MTATATAEAPAARGPGMPPRNAEEAAALAAAPAATPVPAPPMAIPSAAPSGRGPVRIKERPAGAADPVPREPLFFIVHEDGTETPWTIPVVAPEYIWVSALAITVTRGTGAAEVYMMQEMLGPAGWQALTSSKAMTRADYRQMVTVVRDKVVGPQEADPNR